MFSNASRKLMLNMYPEEDPGKELIWQAIQKNNLTKYEMHEIRESIKRKKKRGNGDVSLKQIQASIDATLKKICLTQTCSRL